jgi:hypothetical protein
MSEIKEQIKSLEKIKLNTIDQAQAMRNFREELEELKKNDLLAERLKTEWRNTQEEIEQAKEKIEQTRQHMARYEAKMSELNGNLNQTVVLPWSQRAHPATRTSLFVVIVIAIWSIICITMNKMDIGPSVGVFVLSELIPTSAAFEISSSSLTFNLTGEIKDKLLSIGTECAIWMANGIICLIAGYIAVRITYGWWRKKNSVIRYFRGDTFPEQDATKLILTFTRCYTNMRSRTYEIIELRIPVNTERTDCQTFEVTSPQVWVIESDTRFLSTCPIIVRGYNEHGMNTNQWHLDVGISFENINWKEDNIPSNLGARQCRLAMVTVLKKPLDKNNALIHCPSRQSSKDSLLAGREISF